MSKGTQLHKDGEVFTLDGEGAEGWRLELLPRWMLYRLAPFTAEHRAKLLREALAALQAAQPSPSKDSP